MKKVFLLMMVAVFSVATASAQYYLGGSLGFSNEKTKDGDVELSKTTEFAIAPEFGYNLTEKVDLGISFEFSSEKPGETGFDKTTGWNVSPYVRYNVIQFGQFSILAKAGILFGGKKETPVGEGPDVKTTTLGVNIVPVLKYTLSDKFDLLANLNFAKIDFNQTKVKDGETTTNFGLDVNSNNVANVGGVTIGFAFKF
ncbi:MAG: porin family protein [Dysgonamonadaceae bacterium]|jgi:hypothetical protein|nr:porin family protein [Dysgonamonadaceae bacterium]